MKDKNEENKCCSYCNHLRTDKTGEWVGCRQDLLPHLGKVYPYVIYDGKLEIHEDWSRALNCSMYHFLR